MVQDLKFAVRQLFKAPGFTIAAVTVLALGIGVNTAVFSLVNTLFFAPPAYAKPHEMVQLFSQDKKDPKKFRGFSYPTYLDIREQNTVFSDAMGFNLALIGLGQKGDTRRAFAAIVSSNYFSVLGVPLARGRAFLPEEETPGRNAPVAIVSYSYWLKHDLDPSVVGSQVLINGRPFTIVGITPKGFAGTLADFVTGSLVADERLRSGRERFWVEEQDRNGRSQWHAVAHHRAAKTGDDGGHGQACARRAGEPIWKKHIQSSRKTRRS